MTAIEITPCSNNLAHPPHEYWDRRAANRSYKVLCRGIGSATDPVTHPSHYTRGNIEVIDFIEDQQLNYHRGNAIKYIARAGHKDPDRELEDLSKASWYITREIELLKKEH